MVDKLERQMSLLATLLQTERGLTASEIQRQVEGYPDDKIAFRRSFERDKDDFRRLGVPIEVVSRQAAEGPIDTYRVQRDDYYLHDLGLDPDETVALAMALRLIRLEGGDADDALWKLGGAALGDSEPTEIGAIAMGPAVAQLHDAIRRSVTVSFEYRGHERNVEPWRLAFRRGHWYVEAFDIDRGEGRSFRLDRVDGAITVGDRPAEAVRVPGRSERQPWEFGDEESVQRARVAIDSTHAGWARRYLGGASVVAEHDDGSIEIELAVTNVAGFRNLVLGMLDAAEVLSPQALRDDVVNWLEAQT